MFYTGIDPRTLKPVYVPKTKREKAMQRALLQYRNPKKYEIVYEALVEAGREDLIGYGPKCLIRPKESSQAKGNFKGSKNNTKNRQNGNSKSKNNVGQGKKGKGKEKATSYKTSSTKRKSKY